jgi:hypothetical protein
VVAKKDVSDLASDGEWSYIALTLAEPNEPSQKYLLSLLTARKVRNDSLALIEFPGILLASYKSILENLQTRWKHPYLPFSSLIGHPSPEHPNREVRSVDPPSYSTQDPHFTYDLAPIRSANSTFDLRLSPFSSQDDDTVVKRLEQETTLDKGQFKALIAGLTQELALIQGNRFLSASYNFKGHRVRGKRIWGWSWSRFFCTTSANSI